MRLSAGDRNSASLHSYSRDRRTRTAGSRESGRPPDAPLDPGNIRFEISNTPGTLTGVDDYLPGWQCSPRLASAAPEKQAEAQEEDGRSPDVAFPVTLAGGEDELDKHKCGQRD